MTNFYPPILASTQAAFVAGVNPLYIYYSISDLMDGSRIGHIDIKILRQRDNASVVDTSKFPDGIIYQTYNSSLNYVTISLSDLTISSWQADEIYKIQLRFGYGDLWGDDLSDFAEWRANQINMGYFGEWSNVMMVKAIQPVSLNTYVLAENTVLPTVCGSCDSPSDPEDSFQFRIRKRDINEIIQESGWIKHTSERDQWVINTPLEEEELYRLEYKIRTISGYESNYTTYDFNIIIVNIDALDNITITAEPNNENAYNLITIEIEDGTELSGNYIISRSVDGTYWEDLQFYLFSHKDGTIEYRDYCIESGIKYQYGFQFENNSRFRTSRNLSTFVQCDFAYSYLYADGVQLRLQFNNQINSFKHTVLASKQDTLGSKFPTISRNGYAYYGEFPISALISYHTNSDTFFTEGTNGLYYKGELVLKQDRFAPLGGGRTYYDPEDPSAQTDPSTIDYTIDTNLFDPNIFIERKFREKAEEFLNNGAYKLFKSPTEGSFIVSLMNVSLTPNQTLGRLVSSFQSTAYEVMDFTIDNLNNAGIISRGKWTQYQPETQYLQRLGQASSSSSGTDLLAQINATLNEDEEFYNLIEIGIQGDSGVAVITITTTEGTQDIFVLPGRTYTNNALLNEGEEVVSITATSQTPLTLDYKYIYVKTAEVLAPEVIYISLKDINYQLDTLTASTDVLEIVKDELLSNLQTTTFPTGSSGHTVDSSTLDGTIADGYVNSDTTLKVWYLDIEIIDIQDAPANSIVQVAFENSSTTISTGVSGSKTFYPHRDNIASITLPSTLGNMIVEAKVSLVYEILDEVNHA